MKLISIAAAALIISGAARAADFSAPVLDAAGKAISTCPEVTPECQKPATLGYFASSALFATFPDENDPRTGATITPEEKVKRAALALKVINGGKVDLTSEEATLVKKVIGKAYAPIVVYRAWAMLDPASVAKPEALR